MIHEMKLEEILKNCPKSIAENALRKNGMPTKGFFEWMVARLYKVEKAGRVKDNIIELMQIREKTKDKRMRKLFDHNFGD